ncbi:MAG: hypothetical protein Q4B12_01285 [Bowdeniella nasicola]|nr:hypothetical protein [Bowdeniella nasicola]
MKSSNHRALAIPDRRSANGIPPAHTRSTYPFRLVFDIGMAATVALGLWASSSSMFSRTPAIAHEPQQTGSLDRFTHFTII